MSRRIRRLGAIVAAAALAGLALPPSATAYVRSTTDRGTPVYWPSGCVWIHPDELGSPDMPLETVVSVLGSALANWQTKTNACSYLRIHQDPPAASEAKLDKEMVLKFRTDRWCRPADGDRPEMCYSDAAAAITTVFYTTAAGKPNDGAIVDADIEMNSVDFTFMVVPSVVKARDGTMIADLENTLTHELGHFQGLDHTCWDHVQASQPKDHRGQPVPDCTDVTMRRVAGYSLGDYLRITEATMYNFAAPGETKKRSPEGDDVDGICGIYPSAKDPGECVRPGEGGCSVDGSRPPARPSRLPLAGLALIALGALTLLRRRR